jgi:serine/threonine protein kinase
MRPDADETSPDALTSPARTDAGTVLGTAGYMSPEQVRGQVVDHRSDIFSFGAVLFEALTGRRAFSGSARGLVAVNLAGKERLVARVAGRLVLQDIAPDGRVLLTHVSSRREVLCRPPGETRERDFSWLDSTFTADLSPDGALLPFGESGEGGGPRYSVHLRRPFLPLPG